MHVGYYEQKYLLTNQMTKTMVNGCNFNSLCLIEGVTVMDICYNYLEV